MRRDGHEGAKAPRNTKDWCGGIGHKFTNVRMIFGEGLVRRDGHEGAKAPRNTKD